MKSTLDSPAVVTQKETWTPAKVHALRMSRDPALREMGERLLYSLIQRGQLEMQIKSLQMQLNHVEWTINHIERSIEEIRKTEEYQNANRRRDD